MKTMGRTLYQCSVCDANPSKRHNVERHVWLQHVRKWMNLRTQEYQVSMHKKYVERYIRKQSEAGGTLHSAPEDYPPGEFQPLPFKEEQRVVKFEQEYEEAAYNEQPDGNLEQETYLSDANVSMNGSYANTLPSLPLSFVKPEVSPDTTPQSRIGSPPQSPNSGASQTAAGDFGFGDMTAPPLPQTDMNVYGSLEPKPDLFPNELSSENATPEQDDGAADAAPVVFENYLAQLAQNNINHYKQAQAAVARTLSSSGSDLTGQSSLQFDSSQSMSNPYAAMQTPGSYPSVSPPLQQTMQMPQQEQNAPMQPAMFLPQLAQPQAQVPSSTAEGSMYQMPGIGGPNQQLESMYLHLMAGYAVGINPAQFRASS
eukprot:comp21895_c0_seq1/m.31382 comp21895_c0_seq1/g.31382  ORF comp21895_c0_seq1/g.31382 comp21895_c0_seq1/m.31382 type:complete len:370 (-) comp21895_c0_seq1:596-1705(-)